MERAQLRQLLGVVGSVVLFIGVFLPIITIPIMGDINYFQNGRNNDGIILIALSVISLVFVMGGWYRGLWLTGVGAFVILALTMLTLDSRLVGVKAQMARQVEDNPFAEIGTSIIDLVQIQYGWAVLIVGAGCLIASAAITLDRAPSNQRGAIEASHPTGSESWACPKCSENNPGTSFECMHCGHRLI